MEKVLKKMPGPENGLKASTVLQINKDHAILGKLTELHRGGDAALVTYAKLLLAEAKLLAGLTIENPQEFASLLSSLMI